MEKTAWAAGFFEGEGTIRYHNGRVHLSLGNTDKDVLDRFADVVGGKVMGPYKGQGKKTPSHYKPVYQWYTSSIENTQAILRLFWPYLGERRRSKAAEVIALYFIDDRKRYKKNACSISSNNLRHWN